MKDHRIGLRYARSLFELAETGKVLERVHEELRTATELVAKHPEISHLLMNTTIAREEKEDFVEKILPEKTSGLLINFIKVLIHKKRFQDLGLIQEKFQRLFEEKKGIQHVKVESPILLDQMLRARLTQALEKRMKREIILEPSVNPEMLGGLILDFEGMQIDASYRTQLKELKQTLLAPTLK